MAAKRLPNGPPILEYHAAYYNGEDGWVVAEVLDFPGTVSQGRTLTSARAMLRDALKQMAEYLLLSGERLPRPRRRGPYERAIPLKPIFKEAIKLRLRAQPEAAR